MSDTVAFTAMEHASRADYDLVFDHDAENIAEQADRIIGWLRMMDGDSPYQVTFRALLADCDSSGTGWGG